MFRNSIRQIRKSALNILSWHTRRRIVILESDDWGSIRMPSRRAFDVLVRKGYKLHDDPYSRFDALESERDLSNLFDVLTKHKDSNGNSPVITANCLVANPDFERIKRDDFEVYHYESVVETFRKYPDHSSSYRLWREGCERGIFHPQFHGREHVNVALWMRALRQGNKSVLDAFDVGTFAINSDETIGARNNYMASFDYYSHADMEALDKIIEDGLAMFRDLFGYNSESCIAPCYTWGDSTEAKLAQLGVKYIQGIAKQKLAFPKGNRYSYIFRRCGEQNALNQYYLIRNCFFEPSQSSSLWGLDSCLSSVKNAFAWRSPAVIGTHRLNFVGFLDERNRDRNLKLLDRLLGSIRASWPDVEFMTSDQLGKLIEESQFCDWG